MGTVTRAVVCMIVVVTASHPVGNRFFVALSHGRLTAGPHRHEHEDSDRGDRDDQQLTQCVERPEIHEDDVDDVRAATTWNCLLRVVRGDARRVGVGTGYRQEDSDERHRAHQNRDARVTGDRERSDLRVKRRQPLEDE